LNVPGLDLDSRDRATGFFSLASAEEAAGDLDGAERDYREGLRISRAANDLEGVSSMTGELASLALKREDWPGAEALAREALLLAEDLGRLELIASCCRYLAQALVRRGRKDDALRHAKRAVELYTRLGSPDLTEARETLAECES
jgi:tetratricopeptide (TPR) repeat protein